MIIYYCAIILIQHKSKRQYLLSQYYGKTVNSEFNLNNNKANVCNLLATYNMATRNNILIKQVFKKFIKYGQSFKISFFFLSSSSIHAKSLFNGCVVNV